MIVMVVEHYNDGRQRDFEGREVDVRGELLKAYPFLLTKFGPHADTAALVKGLDRQQAYSASTASGDLILKSDRVSAGADESVVGDQLGGWHRLQRLFDAAAFLAGGVDPTVDPRHALALAGEDPENAALIAYSLEPGEPGLRALRAVLASQEPLSKAEDLSVPQTAKPATPDAQGFAEAVQRALGAGSAFPVRLGGKHSSGSLLALDPQTRERFLLKPGSGGQSPASGAGEETASQAKREAAGYAAATVFGVQAVVPEAHLLLLDGSEYAALRLLPFTYQSAMDVQAKDPGTLRRLFATYRPTGDLHRWAAFDYAIGQTDRHAGNVMVRPPAVALIDYGSAFAGRDFAPALDRLTFVPFYLRALAPGEFSQLDPEGKLRALPRLNAEGAAALKAWLDGIDDVKLGAALERHGVDPKSTLDRLGQLRAGAGYSPADLAINAAWTIP
jgi:hypothetical protein